MIVQFLLDPQSVHLIVHSAMLLSLHQAQSCTAKPNVQ